jgi:hypothetical protein
MIYHRADPKTQNWVSKFQIPMTNQASDYENGSETLIDLKMKLVLG